jgi:hypothetical protein
VFTKEAFRRRARTVDNSKRRSWSWTTRGSSPIFLAQGYHELIVRYYQGGGGNMLAVYWDPSAQQSWTPIPGTAYYHRAVQLAGVVGGVVSTWGKSSVKKVR